MDESCLHHRCCSMVYETSLYLIDSLLYHTGAVLLRLYVHWISAENPRSFIRIIRKENYHHTGNSGFSIMIPGNIEVSQNVWALGMLDYVASAITGFLLLRLCMLLNAERFKSKVTRALRTIGRYSLYILCVHTMEYLAFPWTKVQSLVSGHVVLGIVITFIMRCLIIAAGSELLKRCLERRRRKKK